MTDEGNQPRDGYIRAYALKEYGSGQRLDGRLQTSKSALEEEATTIVGEYYKDPKAFKENFIDSKKKDGTPLYPKTIEKFRLLGEYGFVPQLDKKEPIKKAT